MARRITIPDLPDLLYQRPADTDWSRYRRVELVYPDNSRLIAWEPPTYIDDFSAWPTGWADGGQTRGVMTTGARSWVKQGVALIRPGSAGYDNWWAMPGGGLGAYPGAGRIHRFRWQVDTANTGDWFWYPARRGDTNKLRVRFRCSDQQITLDEYNNSTTISSLATLTGVSYPAGVTMETVIGVSDGTGYAGDDNIGAHVLRVEHYQVDPAANYQRVATLGTGQTAYSPGIVQSGGVDQETLGFEFATDTSVTTFEHADFVEVPAFA